MTLALSAASPASWAQKFITVASTTSTEQSGLFKHILPIFQKKTGIEVRVVALGTGQSLDMGKRGDADVVFVHARSLEDKFIAEGYGVKRFPVVYNDFVLIGPKPDPAKIAGARTSSKHCARSRPLGRHSFRAGTRAALIRPKSRFGNRPG